MNFEGDYVVVLRFFGLFCFGGGDPKITVFYFTFFAGDDLLLFVLFILNFYLILFLFNN